MDNECSHDLKQGSFCVFFLCVEFEGIGRLKGRSVGGEDVEWWLGKKRSDGPTVCRELCLLRVV